MRLFFVHIPKTAGTSFRLGLEKYLGRKKLPIFSRFFGRTNVYYDYGAENEETTSVVTEMVHQEDPDVWALSKKMREEDVSLFCGHVSAQRYVSILGSRNTVTFVRRPVDRLISEYRHFVRHYEYQGDLSTFYSLPKKTNVIHNYLQSVPLESLGFIGITERYNESVELFNHRYNMSIPLLHKNYGDDELLHRVSSEDVAEIERLNQKDIMLYAQCCELFETRLQLYHEGLPFAHARLTCATTKQISGWAWWSLMKADAPVDIEIWLNGERAQVVRATHFRPDLCCLNPPRGGYVGFHLKGVFSPEDRVQCRVAETGQWFPASPQTLIVPKLGVRN